MNENFFGMPKQEQKVELVEMTTDGSFIEPTIEELDEMFGGLKAVMPTTETGVKSKEKIISETKEKITNLVDSISSLPDENEIKIPELTRILEKLKRSKHVDGYFVNFFRDLVAKKIIYNDDHKIRQVNEERYHEVMDAIYDLAMSRFREEDAVLLDHKLNDVRSGIDDL